jgi:vitamin B12 transporter
MRTTKSHPAKAGRSNISRALTGASLAFGALFAGAAHAQQAQDDADATIVVTATLRPTPVEELPNAVTVVTEQEIEDNAYQTLWDTLARVPGVQAVQSGQPGAITSVFTRGTNSKHTLALFDGIRLNDASTPNGQYNFGQDTVGDVSRVEIVRGPVSAIYGSDALGGVVNLIPRIGGERPFEPFFDVSYGSFDTLRVVGGAQGAQGPFSYGLTGEVFRTEGFNQTPDRFVSNDGEEDGAKIFTVTGTGRYALTSNLALTGLVRVRDAESDFDTFSGGPSGFARADDPDLRVSQDRYFLYRVGLEAELLDGRLSSALRLGQLENERAEENGGATTSEASGERTFANFTNTLEFGGEGFFSDTALTFGLDYQEEAIVVTPSFGDGIDESEDTFGGFVVLQTSLADVADVTVAGRLDDYENFGTEGTYSIGFTAPVGPARVFANYGTSFKAPTLSERFGTSFFNIGNPDLEPETAESLDVGAEVYFPLLGRTDGFGFGVTYFSIEIENLIEYNFAALQNINIGRASSDGYEAFVEVSPTDWLTARVNYTNTDATNDITGARLLRRPVHSWTGILELRPTDRLRVSVQVLDVGSRRDVNYDNDGFFLGSGGPLEGFTTTRLTSNYDLTDEVTLYWSVNNLTDEEYEQPEAYAGAPRSVTVGVRGRF